MTDEVETTFKIQYYYVDKSLDLLLQKYKLWTKPVSSMIAIRIWNLKCILASSHSHKDSLCYRKEKERRMKRKQSHTKKKLRGENIQSMRGPKRKSFGLPQCLICYRFILRNGRFCLDGLN